MLTAGDRVERFAVEAHLGGGGMAQVYRVRHLDLGAPMALKVLALPHPSLHERILREGRIQAQLAHPNVVRVRDVLHVDGQPALLLDLVEGPTLAVALDHYRPSADQIDAVAHDVLAGVAAAHAVGIVHRDLKPANVLLDPTGGDVRARVTDFGIAKARGDEGDTRTGATLGTPRYMAPEQIRSAAAVDARADVFALGCLLYEWVCGVPAYVGDDLVQLFDDMKHHRYRPISAWASSAPRRWRDAIEAALRADPAERPADAGALLAVWSAGAPRPAAAWEPEHVAILRGLAPAGTSAPETVTGTMPPPPAGARRRPLAVAVAVAATGVVAALLVPRGPNAPATPGGAPAAAVAPAAEVASPAAPPPAEEAQQRAEPPAARPTPPPSPRAAAVTPAARAAPSWGYTGASDAWLVGADGARHAPGEAPSGRYRLVARFGSSEPREQLTVDLAVGDHRVFTCVSSLKVCR